MQDSTLARLTSQTDVKTLEEKLALYEGASPPKRNWSRSEILLLGEWGNKEKPALPAGLQWNTEGMKFLGVFLGNEGFISKNWEGVVEKVSARLSRWTWILPELSYRGRVLVANNLIGTSLRTVF